MPFLSVSQKKFDKSKDLLLFIDGTVAGNPADSTVYKDATIAHDHSYYGRGCKNGWGGDGSGGSITPCADSDAGGRYVVTSDGETQKNGTYMNFQAASSGSGATITTQDTVVPDSFCPLGWQLPYSGTGGDYYDKSKSWRYLLQTYSITSGSGSSSQDTRKMTSYPFSNVFNGYTYWVNGRIYEQSHFTILWSSTNSSADGVYWFVMHPTDGIRKVEGTQKTRGNGIRCAKIFSIPSSTARWQEHQLLPLATQRLPMRHIEVVPALVEHTLPVRLIH